MCGAWCHPPGVPASRVGDLWRHDRALVEHVLHPRRPLPAGVAVSPSLFPPSGEEGRRDPWCLLIENCEKSPPNVTVLDPPPPRLRRAGAAARAGSSPRSGSASYTSFRPEFSTGSRPRAPRRPGWWSSSARPSSGAASARREGITRARVTQVMGLLRLAPEIQEHVLSLPDMVRRTAITERALRPIAQLADQTAQRSAFAKLLEV